MSEYKGKVVYEGNNLNSFARVPVHFDFHSHGAWTDYKQGLGNLEYFPRYLGALARKIQDKELNISGLVDIQADGFSEKRFEKLKKTLDEKADSYSVDLDSDKNTIFINFIRGVYGRVGISRVQEVLTNIPKVHYLAVGLDKDVPGGKSPSDTVNFIKDNQGYVIVDHPYFTPSLNPFKLTQGNNFVELNRDKIDAIEYNGQLNVKMLAPSIKSFIAGVLAGDISLKGLENILQKYGGVDYNALQYTGAGMMGGLIGAGVGYSKSEDNKVLGSVFGAGAGVVSGSLGLKGLETILQQFNGFNFSDADQLTAGIIAGTALTAPVALVTGYMNYCNNLVFKKAEELDLPIIGSSDANTPNSIGKTRTVAYLNRFQLNDEKNLVKNIFRSISKGNYEVLSEKDSISRMIGHVIKGYYSQFRANKKWFYNCPDSEKIGIPSA